MAQERAIGRGDKRLTLWRRRRSNNAGEDGEEKALAREQERNGEGDEQEAALL